MRKGCVILVGVFSLSFIALSLPCSRAYAHHKERVLGESTVASQLNVGQGSGGPGFILPDSPLYFVDQVFQSVRLLVAFDNKSRANVRARIAQERLAELRVMVARENEHGMNTALEELSKEVGFAAKEVANVSATGGDVKPIARLINEEIKLHRKILGELANQSRGTLKLRFKTARKALKEAKVEVEDELNEEELEREIEEGLDDELDEEIADTNDIAEELERDLGALVHEASEAARKELRRREETLQRAIAEKNEELRRVEEKRLEQARSKQSELHNVREEAVSQAKKAVEEAKSAAKKFEKAKQRVKEVRNSSEESIPASPNESGGSSSE